MPPAMPSSLSPSPSTTPNSDSHNYTPLPYFAPSDLLPSRPLPSFRQILSSHPSSSSSSSSSSLTQTERTIFRVGTDYVVKYGTGLTPVEGWNMLFLSRHAPELRTPRLYAMYEEEVRCACPSPSPSPESEGKRRKGKGKGKDQEWTTIKIRVIIQEFIPGRSLQDCWRDLNYKQRDAIAAQLRLQLGVLRHLRAPFSSSSSSSAASASSFYGTLSNSNNNSTTGATTGTGTVPGPYQSAYWTRNTLPGDAGPFATESDFADAVFRIEASPASNPWDLRGTEARRLAAARSRREFARLAWRSGEGGTEGGKKRPVFTHADLLPQNILLRWDDDDDDDDEEEDSEVKVPTPVLIDWEMAGWYPAYWEYVSAAQILPGGRVPLSWTTMLKKVILPVTSSSSSSALASTTATTAAAALEKNEEEDEENNHARAQVRIWEEMLEVLERAVRDNNRWNGKIRALMLAREGD
ncbi:hypothetical protein F4778DRAFT_787258 [Xylariomycetidae sp. FL2044]|nr:hypothetical protein F4778DRAFT_787258 [Xylariomycetidae sp. FL2044]